MLLIADGGSTKVDWCLIDRGNIVKKVSTSGANPFFRSREDISRELADKLVPVLKVNKVEAVYFYGAGCAFPEKNQIIREAIADNLNAGTIEVGSDLLGAAIGLCNDQPGIVCILGTGSNSCFYDGREIVKNVSPLGYILGDEGSGAVLGRLFTGACLKNQFTGGIRESFLEYLDMDVSQLLDRVYKQPLANQFLASIVPFIHSNIHEAGVHELVCQAFTDFFKKNVMQYDHQEHAVFFTGSVAYYFKDILREVAASLNIHIEKIEQSPMSGLIRYHTSCSV
ncbi:MAG TPA: ATPase [Paludibacter sp.]|nr:ATPase [Paludibacter sp.]